MAGRTSFHESPTMTRSSTGSVGPEESVRSKKSRITRARSALKTRLHNLEHEFAHEIHALHLADRKLQHNWAGVAYSPEEYSTCMGYLRLFFRYQHTILPTVWTSGFFWSIVASHGILQGIEHSLHDWEDHTVEYHWTGLVSARPGIDGLPRIDWKAASVSLSLLVFSTVFYINTQYNRYTSLCVSRRTEHPLASRDLVLRAPAVATA